MILRHLKVFFHTLADGDAWHNDDEFAPAIPCVQLKHRFDVNVSFPGSGLHFNIQRTTPDMLHQRRRKHDIVVRLNLPDIVQQIGLGKFDFVVAEAVGFIAVPVRAG